MRYFLYVYIILLTSCAVQGPISGGQIDQSPPILLDVTPENFTTNIRLDQEITLIFDELIDPSSIYSSIANREGYKIKTKGKKIIISPIEGWDNSELINISINRNLKDFQGNSISSPIDLYFSPQSDIPTNKIIGKILDINHMIPNLNNDEPEHIYEIALFDDINISGEPIRRTQSDSELGFNLTAIPNGNYIVVAALNQLSNPIYDLKNKLYSISTATIFINEDNSNQEILLNIANPYSQKNIYSISPINQYLVNYIFTDGTEQRGIIDTIYNNYNKINLSGDTLILSLNLENDFENYKTEPFSYIVPFINDTIAPFITEINVNEKVNLVFSEPLDYSNVQYAFYVIQDSSEVYIEKSNISTKNDISFSTLESSITLNLNDVYSNFYIKTDMLTDFSGNSIQDSLVHITWNNTTNKKPSIGRIIGKVVYPDAHNSIAIHTFNSATGERNVVISDSSGKFMFDNLSPGFYYLQAYENHESNLSDFYPYFGGSWSPFFYSKKFSEFIGPIEVRANWDIEDIELKIR